MSLHDLARTIYLTIGEDAAALAALESALTTMAVDVLTSGSASQTILSATVNGQTFQALAGLSVTDRMTVIRRVLRMAELGGCPSKIAIPQLSP